MAVVTNTHLKKRSRKFPSVEETTTTSDWKDQNNEEFDSSENGGILRKKMRKSMAIYGSNSILNFPERRRPVEKDIMEQEFCPDEAEAEAEEEELPDHSFSDLGCYGSEGNFQRSDDYYHGFWEKMLDSNGWLKTGETFASNNNGASENYSSLDDIKKMLLDEEEEEDETGKWKFPNLGTTENQNPTVQNRTIDDDSGVKMEEGKKNPEEETENSERKEDDLDFCQFGSLAEGDEKLDLLDEILCFEPFEFSDIIDGL